MTDWFDVNDELFWDSLFKYICIPSVVLTVVGFVLDLLFSSEAKQGSPILIAPVVFQSVVYTFISAHAQANGMLSHEVLKTFNTTLIGEEIFKRPEIVNMTFFHIGVCDLGLSYVMMLDFYSRVTSRRMLYRVIVAVLAFMATRQGLPPLLFYWLLLRPTLFQGDKIEK